MDFSLLPVSAFLKILGYLPLEDCIRVGRVNKTFRQIGQLATSYTKCLDLGEDRFHNLTPDQLAVILDLCASNLKQIKIGGDLGDADRWRQLASTFSNYECPRLTDIDLETTPIDQPVFEQLIRNNPNVESLKWHKDFVGFPAITNNNLKKLNLKVCRDAILQTLIGRCPNLEELDLWEGNGANEHVTASMLDEFFGSIQHAQRIRINLASVTAIDFEEEELVSFYNLPLKKLSINICCDFYAGDVLLSKVVTSFPHLQELRLRYLEPTDDGIASLAALKELQVLQLDISGEFEPYDEGICQLSRCEKLRELDVYWSKISGGTLVNLLRSCPQLEFVGIYDITEVDRAEEAVVIVESLAGIPKRDITISFNSRRYRLDDDDDDERETLESIWQGEPVKAAIKKLEEDEGMKIMIEKD